MDGIFYDMGWLWVFGGVDFPGQTHLNFVASSG
jgi:hypothetical protein